MNTLEKILPKVFQRTFPVYSYKVEYDAFEKLYLINVFNVPVEKHFFVCEKLWNEISHCSECANIPWTPVLFTPEQTIEAYPEEPPVFVSIQNWRKCMPLLFSVSCEYEQDEYALAA